MSNIKASKLVSKYEVEVGEGILCNPGDPNYIDLQDSQNDYDRLNQLQNFGNNQEYDSIQGGYPNKIKRQSSPVLPHHSPKNPMNMMTTYYKKQKLHSRNVSKQPLLTIDKTQRQLCSDSKNIIDQDLELDGNQRQRTISDPLNTSMLQHEIEEAVNRDISLRNYQKSINNCKTSRNQNLKFVEKSRDNIKSTTISPSYQENLKIMTDPSSKILMSFGSTNMKNLSQKNSQMKQNCSQKQELFSTVQQHSTSITGGLTRQRQSGICLSNISSNNQISICPPATTYETEHSDNGEVITIGDKKNITLSFKKFQDWRNSKTDHQNSKSESQQTSLQNNISKKQSIITLKSQLSSQKVGRQSNQQLKHSSIQDFSSQIKLVQQRKDNRIKAESKDHISRQGSFQGLDLQSNKSIPHTFFTSNNTPISRDAKTAIENKNTYQKFSDYCFQNKQKLIQENRKKEISLIPQKKKLLESVILPAYQQVSSSRKQINRVKDKKSGKRKMDIHNIVSERKREPLSPQPIPILGEFEYDLCPLQTSLDNNVEVQLKIDSSSCHKYSKISNSCRNNRNNQTQNQNSRQNIQNQILNYIVNSEFSQRRKKIDQSARLQQTFQIKAFNNQKEENKTDIRDLYAQHVLKNCKRDYNLQKQQSYSHELQHYFKQNNDITTSTQRITSSLNNRKSNSMKKTYHQYPRRLDKKYERSKFTLKISKQKQLRSSSSSSQSHIHIQSVHNISKSIDNTNSYNNSITMSQKATPKLSEQHIIQNQKISELKTGSQTASNIATPLNKTAKVQAISREVSLQRQKQNKISQKISNNIASKIAKSKQNLKLNKNSNKLMNKNQKFVNQHYHNQSSCKNKSAQTKSINQSLYHVGQKQRRQKYLDSDTISSFKLGIKSEQTKKGYTTRDGCRIDQETPTNNRVNNVVTGYNTASFKLQSTPPEARVAYSGNPTVKNRSPISRSPIQSCTILNNRNSNNRMKSEREHNHLVKQQLYAQSYQLQQQHNNKSIKQLLGAQIKRSKYMQKEINKEEKRKNAIAQKILLRQSSSHAIKHYRPQIFQTKEQNKSVLKKISTEEEQEDVMILKDTIYFPEEVKSAKQTNCYILPQHSGDNTKVNSTQGTNNISSTGSQQATIDISSKREQSSTSRKRQIKRAKYKQRGQITYAKSKTQLIQESQQFNPGSQFTRRQGKGDRDLSSSISSAKSRDISSSRLMKFSKYLTSVPDQ